MCFSILLKYLPYFFLDAYFTTLLCTFSGSFHYLIATYLKILVWMGEGTQGGKGTRVDVLNPIFFDSRNVTFWHCFDVSGCQGLGGEAEGIWSSTWGTHISWLQPCVHEQVSRRNQEEEEHGTPWWRWSCSSACLVSLPIMDDTLLV